MSSAEDQLAGLFARYEPAIAELGQALRAKLSVRLPGLFEIVYLYERQGTLVISYSPTERGHGALCSLALYPEQVKLFFARGPELSASDPSRLLQGSARSVRFVPMTAAADLDRKEIEALMVAALRLAQLRLVAGAPGPTILKVEEQKQRAARASKTPRPAAASRPKKSRP